MRETEVWCFKPSQEAALLLKNHIYSSPWQYFCDSSKNLDLKQIFTCNTVDLSEKTN